MTTRVRPSRFMLPAWIALIVLAMSGAGCRTIFKSGSNRREPNPGDEAAPAKVGSARQARKVVRRSVGVYRGLRRWKARDGLELDVAWKTIINEKVVDENPARIQMVYGPQPQIHIDYTRMDEVYGLGDQGAWAVYKGKPDRERGPLARAKYTTKLMWFYLSLPYVLLDEQVVIENVVPVRWGGRDFETVTIRFRDDTLLWPEDSIVIWFDRSTSLIDRCLFVSTGEGSAFEHETMIGTPPPHYVWIRWTDYEPLDGIPLARKWEFISADPKGTQRKPLFDLEIQGAVANRQFMPVLFREPIVQPNIPHLPKVGGVDQDTKPPIIQRKM